MSNTPILIGIHGVKRAGKDTTANFVEEWASRQVPALSTCRRGFADKAKWAFARQWFPKITMEDSIKWVDRFKDVPGATFTSPPVGYTDDSGMPIAGPLPTQIQFRVALKQFCTDGGRDIYGDDFWVDQLLPDHGLVGIRPGGYAAAWHHYNFGRADICLITDMRFPNEVQRIRDLGGICWAVRRKDAEDVVIEEAKALGSEIHRSDLVLPGSLFEEVFCNDDNDLVLARHRTEIALNMLTLREDLNELQS